MAIVEHVLAVIGALTLISSAAIVVVCCLFNGGGQDAPETSAPPEPGGNVVRLEPRQRRTRARLEG